MRAVFPLLSALLLAASLLLAGTARAEAADATPESCCRPTSEGPWRFTFAGYGWLPDAPAEISIGPVDETIPEDLGTIIDALQFGAMADLELRKGSFGAYFAPIVVFLEDSETVPGVLPLSTHKVTLNEEVFLMDFGLTYEVGRWQLWNHDDWILPSPAVTVEPFVGGRALIDDIKVKLKPPGRTFKTDLNFVAPVIGLHTFWDLTDRLNLRISGDYGGFNVDHLKETYNAVGLVGWRFKPKPHLNINVFAGYRFLHIDYKKIAEIKVDIKGPFIGLAFEFSSE